MSVKYWDSDVYFTDTIAAVCPDTMSVEPPIKESVQFTFFVSCYNEESYIIDTLNEIVKAMDVINKTYEVIVIDDCSSDSSVERVKSFISDNQHLNIILRVNKINKGLGQNYVDGAFIGSGKYYRLVCGDNAEPSDTLVDVLSRAGDADIIVPYHLDVKGKSKIRKFISRMYTRLINLISGNKVRYYNGLHLYQRQHVMRWHSNTRGFAFQASLLCQLLDKGFTYKEVPVMAYDRREERANALTWKNIRSVMHVVLSISLRRLVA